MHAAQTRSSTTIEDRQIATGRLLHPGPDHHDILGWLWTVLLADGLRALCRAGRWADALRHAEQHHGIGERLLDGRQIAIIAYSVTGQHTHAAHLLTRRPPAPVGKQPSPHA